MNYWTQSNKNIFVAAHRGWPKNFPENTMISFRNAVHAGVDQLETDVHMTKDGELVLMHDTTLDRTTNGTGLLKNCTLAQLKQLDASYKFPQFAGEKIPTLREFFEEFAPIEGMTFDIEFKVYPEEGQEDWAYEATDKIIAMIEEFDLVDRVVVNSWHAQILEYVEKKWPGKYRIHAYYPYERMKGVRNICPAEYAYCACVLGPAKSGIIGSGEDYAYVNGTKMESWTSTACKTKEQVVDAIEKGTTLITCNNVDEILQYLKELGYHK